ncbi:hypothetical protein KL932_004247 [Ogataea haglerorum]|uniref:Uncharacterized protein n=1 Tax=Ogataea haglerorum TaxID=1937702 RepID=A0ABQ7RBS3_9ASCO|nr:hypothetical protein KL932_004247 [Ogataea haglerorum]KAG7762761.1 hypothetical protein KL946_004502 [Ogataea haglerorum]
MQPWFNKLGRQGRQLALQWQYAGESWGVATPTPLDYLFDELVSPKSSTTPDKILSYLAYYYPKLKNEHNVELLTLCFLRCPLFFNDAQLVSFNDNYRVIEFFKYIMDKKFQVSQPTLPFHRFYNALFGAVEKIAADAGSAWKVIPVVVGCLLSVDSRSDYDRYPEHFKLIAKIDAKFVNIAANTLVRSMDGPLSKDLLCLNVVALSCVQDKLTDSQLLRILRVRSDMLRILTELTFNSPYGLDNGRLLLKGEADTPIVVRHLNRISFLFAKLTSIHPKVALLVDDLDLILNRIQTFSENVLSVPNPTETQWSTLRVVLFAQVMMFEGVMARFFQINDHSLNRAVLPTLSRKILTALFNFNFVVDRMGTGGFESYNFVYASCLSALTSYDISTAETLIKCWTSSIAFKEIHNSAAERGKLLFDLQFIENVVNLVSDSIKFNFIIPIVQDLIGKSHDQAVLESAHSVMVKYFTSVDTYNEAQLVDYTNNVKHVGTQLIDYLTLSLDQFPVRLSLSQVGVIVETLAKITFPDTAVHECDPELYRELILLVYNRCLVATSEELPDAREPPRTRHGAFTSLLIRILPLVPFDEYQSWLERTLSLAYRTVGDERTYLLDLLWDSILGANRHYPQKGNVGIQWWYEHVNQNQEKAKL